MFESLKGKRAALICYATAFFPDEGASKRVIKTILNAGADAVEVGIPFSDPVMDGPVIQRATDVALRSGATPRKILKMIREIRSFSEKPILIMSYYNPIFRYGLEEFAHDAKFSGVDGLIIPDVPSEEMQPLRESCDLAGLATVAFCPPTTTLERIEKAADMTTGFLYCVSLLGTTGARDELSPEIPSLISRVRKVTDIPLAIGVGISTPEQCAKVGSLADAVIVGSALMKIVDDGMDFGRLEELVLKMASALNSL